MLATIETLQLCKPACWSLPGACSVYIVEDRQTDRPTDRQTDREIEKEYPNHTMLRWGDANRHWQQAHDQERGTARRAMLPVAN